MNTVQHDISSPSVNQHNPQDDSRRSFLKLVSLAGLGAISGFAFRPFGESDQSDFLNRIFLNSLMGDAIRIQQSLQPESIISQMLASGSNYAYAGVFLNQSFEQSQLSDAIEKALQKKDAKKSALLCGMFIRKQIVPKNFLALSDNEIAGFILTRYNIHCDGLTVTDMAAYFETAWWRALIKQHTIIPEETDTDEWINNLNMMREKIKTDSEKAAIILFNACNEKKDKSYIFNSSDYKLLKELKKKSDLNLSVGSYVKALTGILNYFEKISVVKIL